ncbi:MAG: FGGY-family carbohydrate kinase [Phycisphaerae bacterium]|nr:FGGY family carbohydrate kinase [Tepidisphaeraceae bacterium]
MNLLALDLGSSSVKAAVLHHGQPVSDIARVPFATRYDGNRVEVDPAAILKALAKAIRELGPHAKRVDLVALATMGPSWVAMDKRGKALTPIVTHQDRRSTAVAVDLEKRVGKKRHLSIVGTRPIPGGISSTTYSWFLQNAPGVMKRADLVGHLTTFVHRQMTHSRVVDPSHASFMGLYDTMKHGGWHDGLIEAVGASEHCLPQVLGADEIAGMVTRDGQRQFGLRHGTPVLTGLVDGSAAMLLAGAKPGQLVNVCGSTDVLALCCEKPTPHEQLLTRSLGVGDLFLSVSTVASSGSSLVWAHKTFFPDLTDDQFFALVGSVSRDMDNRQSAIENRKSAKRADAETPSVLPTFHPYLAGDRTSVEQPTGAFTNLTLSTTRHDLLAAILRALAKASADRLPLLQAAGNCKLSRKVFLTGGADDTLHAALTRDWPGHWSFQPHHEATLIGLSKLPPLDL